MIFEDRIQKNPRLFRLKDPRTNEIVDFEIQDLLPEEIEQEGTEVDAAYLNGLLTYSMEEKQVGYWIDGKPLYRKVVSFGALPNADTKRVEHGISNLKNVINVSGIAKRYIPASQTYSWQPLPLLYAGNSTDFNASLSVNPTNISIACDKDRTDFTENYIFIEYTKTTD